MICFVYVHPNAFETPVHTLRHKEERTAGELASALVGDVEEVDAPERGVHGGGEAGAGEALEARVEAEVLARCQRSHSRSCCGHTPCTARSASGTMFHAKNLSVGQQLLKRMKH